jgi:hypothetical protein
MLSEEEIINKVLDRLRTESPQKDYTLKELTLLLQRNAHEMSMSADKFYGHYKVGRFHFFVRAEIDYRRRMGMNLIKN